MKKTIFIGFIFLLPFLTGGCSDGPSDSINGEFEEASDKKQFVWEGLNYWYYWQQEVPELGDNYFGNEQAYHQYLKSFTDAEALFNELLYSEDRFSWFIENYEVREEAQRGISKSFGFSFGLVYISENGSNIFGYVQYVLPDSPASEAGLERGDLFTGVNGSTLTDSNFRSLLDSDRYVLTMADMEKNGKISKTGETVTVTAEILQENPVYLTKVIDTGSIKVGYLVYNAFRYNYHIELNEAFGKFLNQGVDQLVLDLRYNGGGTLITSAMLAGMISGLDTTDVFAQLTFNQKRQAQNVTYPFLERVPVYSKDGSFSNWIPMNELSLNQVYILTGFGTASASEALINGLKPYINLTLIGAQTVAKDVGSITVYDSPPTYDNKENINPNHKIAMQPIVLKIVNSNGQDYPNGFTPKGNNFIREIAYLEDLPPLGSKNDPLLAQALALITGQPQMRVQAKTRFHRKPIADSRDFQPIGKEMYLLPEYAEELNLFKP